MRTVRSDIKKRFNAILAGQPTFNPTEDMRWTAKKARKQLLHQEEVHIKNVMNESFVGNRFGLNIAGMVTRLAILESQYFSQQGEMAHQQKHSTCVACILYFPGASGEGNFSNLTK